MHNSLVYSLTLYPDQSRIAVPGNVHKLSPIVDISVHSPKSGQRLDIEWKPKTIKEEDFIALLRVTLTGKKTFGGSDHLYSVYWRLFWRSWRRPRRAVSGCVSSDQSSCRSPFRKSCIGTASCRYACAIHKTIVNVQWHLDNCKGSGPGFFFNLLLNKLQLLGENNLLQ